MGDVGELIRGVASTPATELRRRHAERLNPTFIKAIELLGVGRDFVRAEGTRLWDGDGHEYLDFLSGYGANSLGHAHPDVRTAIEEVLKTNVPHFTLIAPQIFGPALAERLARIAPGDLSMAYLANSGSEAVEGALKLARAATHRPRFVSALGGYHGTTLGALSISGTAWDRDAFEPLIPGIARVSWGRADAIERELKRRDVAAVILEPLQAEGGIRLPPPGYLADVQRLCKQYGTLLILDEIQTGLGRTGRMFACEYDGVEPDVLLVAKALSGGLAPISAYITRKDIWRRAYGTLDRYDLHCTTFSGGPIACAAAIATLEIIERDGLVARAAELGRYLGQRIRAATRGHKIVRDVRGRGLLWGIELNSPRGTAADLVGQWVVIGLLERFVVTQVCSSEPRVVRAQPPLTIERADVDTFATALSDTLETHAKSTLRSLTGAATRAVKHTVGAFLERR